MATDIVMPRLSDSMEEGTVLSWIKQVGDQVEVGDELVEIETDKANMVFEADAAGTLIEVIAAEGDTLAIGEVIARVGEADEPSEDSGDGDEADSGDGDEADSGDGDEADSGDGRASPATAPELATATAEPDSPDQPQVDQGGNGRVKASPLARRIARERGLDLSSLQGSGPGGRIIKADVESAESAPEKPSEAAEPAAGATATPETARGTVETVELTKLQQTVSRRMAESKATAPHFYLQTEFEVDRLVAARARLKAAAAEGETVPSVNDMVVKACALALRQFPRANGAYRDGKWELYSRVNVGIAVAATDALVVPTIFDADQKGLTAIATESRALAAKVREQKITPPELSGATFTVSNLGMFGVTNFHAVINSPQAAILAVGAIRETAVVRDGELVAGRLMGATLACDHRILYGADGAEFLARVRALLEEPLGLAL